MCIFEYNEEKAMKCIREDEYSKGIRDGKRDGIKEGMEAGEERFAILVKSLIEDNREDDLIRATADKRYREKLFLEYNLVDCEK